MIKSYRTITTTYILDEVPDFLKILFRDNLAELTTRTTVTAFLCADPLSLKMSISSAPEYTGYELQKKVLSWFDELEIDGKLVDFTHYPDGKVEMRVQIKD